MIHTLAALVLFLLAWAGLRLLCGARFRPVPALLLDGLISAWCWAVVSLATDRLLLGAIITAFGAIGLALANDAKYEALRERLAFSDRAELRRNRARRECASIRIRREGRRSHECSRRAPSC